MAQNTMVWLLSKGLNDIATSGETPKFDIKWSLPIYDHLTDGTVMTDPAANPGPDMDDGTTPPSHNQSAPGDFNGIFYSNAVKYTLTQWPSGSGYTALTETSGWAKNPEWSIASTPFAPGVGENGNTKYAFGSVSSGSFVEGTEPTQKVISAWNTSDLYENVRYDGTSTEDPEEGQDPLAYAHYTVYLRCQETRSDAFIQGDIRFNKVLLFTDIGGEPVPVAMVCLATPITLFANNQGQSNSLAISFQLGFNPNDTEVESVSFDNLYWTKVGEYPDHEGDMRLFSRNKLVLGEIGDDLEGTGRGKPIISAFGDGSSSFFSHICIGTNLHNEKVLLSMFEMRPSFNSLEMYQLNGADPSIRPGTGQGFNSLNIISAYGDGNSSPHVPFSCASKDSLMAIRLTERNKIGIGSFYSVLAGSVGVIASNSSVIVGTNIEKYRSYRSVVVADNLTSLMSTFQYTIELFHEDINGALIIGNEINVAYPITATAGQFTPADPDLTVAVGDKNKIYSGMSNDPIVGHASRTIIFGKNNQVDNSWSSEGWPEPKIVNGEVADSYILGSCNALGRYASKDTSNFNSSQTRNYVFGNVNVVCNNDLGGLSSTTLTNRYILGSANTISLGDTAVVTPDIYIFGSNNTVVVDARSNFYGNNKYVFGSGIAVESWEEFVVGHCSSGLHNENSAHYNNSAIRLMRMGITQGENTGGTEQPGCWSLSVVFGGPFDYMDLHHEWVAKNNLMLPHKSQVLAYPDKFKSGTLCIDNNSQDGDGKFWNVCYYYPTSSS